MAKINLKALNRANLPNTDGFTFMANMVDGSTQQKTVVKNEHGLHLVEDFQNILSWYRIK